MGSVNTGPGGRGSPRGQGAQMGLSGGKPLPRGRAGHRAQRPERGGAGEPLPRGPGRDGGGGGAPGELLPGPRGRGAGWRVTRTIVGWPAPLWDPLPEGPRDEGGSWRGRIEPRLGNPLAPLPSVPNAFLKDRFGPAPGSSCCR